MPRPVHFDITADNPERAVKFYGDAFGWKFEKWDAGEQPYWLIATGETSEPGINGGLSGRAPGGNRGILNTIGVPSVDDAVAKVTKAGGAITRAKMAIPGIGWYAEFTDTEGNAFGLMQDDPSAK
ncbi:MAG TPA: VOC family protein [bacterium]